MHSSRCLVGCDSFTIAKHVLIRVDVPVVLAFVLDTCPDVSVSFLVHFCELILLILRTTRWEE